MQLLKHLCIIVVYFEHKQIIPLISCNIRILNNLPIQFNNQTLEYLSNSTFT